MAWTDFPELAGGDFLDAAFLNIARDNMIFLKSPARFQIRANANKSIPTSAWTTIDFQLEDVDSDNGHSTVSNISRYTIPTGWTGHWVFCGMVRIASNAAGKRICRIRRGGVDSDILEESNQIEGQVSADTRLWIMTPPRFMTEGEYIELQAWQDSGVSLNSVFSLPTIPKLAGFWKAA